MKYLICPLCSQPLGENSQGISCVNRHQFDRAKEGYFNLLPVQYKNSREPGDAKEQLESRQQFLNAGYFFPLAKCLKELVSAETKTLLDIGSGEGYFTRILAEHCALAEVYGIDIAKAGIRLAAKKATTNVTFAVASSYQLPIANDSMDVITRIYAPSKDDELLRVLKKSGRLIIVTPGETHLISLREKIYREIKPYQKLTTPAGFKKVAEAPVTFMLNIPPGDLARALLKMTPFAWKMTPELSEKIDQQGLVDKADFCISVYEKITTL